MLQFKQDDTSAELLLTLTENVSITDPYYLFVFTHVLTKSVVAFVKYSGSDESEYQTRVNKFTIDPSVVFADQPIGEWHYEVYEQASDTNTDPDSSGEVLEYGKMIMNRAVDFSFTQYNQATTYAAYNG